MINRNKRGIGSMRARLAIAAAVLVGGGAAGVVALSSHGTAATAASAGYTTGSHHTMGEGAALSGAFSQWGSSQTRSFNTLSDMTSIRTFNQVWQRHVQFAAQRGVVLLATPKFLVVKSFNGSLHVWWLTVVYPADAAVAAVPWLESATTPAAPPPTSTAAAMARRARILPIPRLLRLIIAASFDGRRPPRAPFRF